MVIISLVFEEIVKTRWIFLEVLPGTPLDQPNGSQHDQHG